MDVYVKRIQSRIKRRYGVSIPLPNIRNIFPSIVPNKALPTDEELWQVVDYFNPRNAHQHFSDFALTGLRQKLSPNETQTSFISSKHVPILLQPIKKPKRHSCSKGN